MVFRSIAFLAPSSNPISGNLRSRHHEHGRGPKEVSYPARFFKRFARSASRALCSLASLACRDPRSTALVPAKRTRSTSASKSFPSSRRSPLGNWPRWKRRPRRLTDRRLSSSVYSTSRRRYIRVQIRAARGLLNWSRRQLSDESGVPFSTISDFEVERSSAVLTTTADNRHSPVMASSSSAGGA